MTATIARLPLDYTRGLAGKPDNAEPYAGPQCVGGCGRTTAGLLVDTCGAVDCNRAATRYDQQHVRWADQ